MGPSSCSCSLRRTPHVAHVLIDCPPAALQHLRCMPKPQIVITASKQGPARGDIAEVVTELTKQVLQDLHSQATGVPFARTQRPGTDKSDEGPTATSYGIPRLLGPPQVLHIGEVVIVTATAEVREGSRHKNA